MNKHVMLNDNTVLCGTVRGRNCVCLREPGHWGIHMFRDENGKPYLLHIGFCEISFEVTEVVAEKAMTDKHWTWSE